MSNPAQEGLFPEFPASPDRLRGPWIPVYIDLFNHGKLHELAEHLQPDILPSDALNYALGTIVRWWGWVFKYAPDGEIGIGHSSTVRAMAAACGWADDPQKLLDALVRSGFAESHKRRTKGHENLFLVAHDWGEHAGSYLKARRDAAKRQAEKRARDKQSRNFVLGNSHGDVTRDVGVTSGTTGTQPEPERNRTGLLPPASNTSSNFGARERGGTTRKRAAPTVVEPAAEVPSASLSGGLSAEIISGLTVEFEGRLSAEEVAAELQRWPSHESFERWKDKLVGGRRWLENAIKFRKGNGTNGTTHQGSIGRGTGGSGAFGGDPGDERNQEFGRNATKRSERVVAARRVRLAALGIDPANIGRAGAVPSGDEPGG